MKYRRANTPGATYFFTLVTYQRQPIFHHPDSIEILRQAFARLNNHGLVKAPKDWAYSSFHRAVRWGLYAEDWGAESRIEGFEGVGKE